MDTWRGVVPLTLPVMMGYLPLGAVFGVLWVDAGLSWYWAPLMSVLVYAGALQYLAVGMLAAGIGWIDLAVAALLVNFRHLFYGLSLYHLLPKGALGRPYFIFGITDETYSLLSASGQVKDSKTALLVTLFNQGYWVLGTLAGVLLARGLPPGLQGLDFALTALFTVLAVEQIRAKKDWGAVALGLLAAAVAGTWVSEYFLLAASLMLVLVLLAWPEAKREAAHV
ncbi:branched-chain amino acid transporter AzlC [Zobellella denitrificans]|jgi:4-azaleucine resistance transporter AzlC|uniref:AzlC family protein n=1 Tax=Zobellella denitrificans TaxID=347534 RepID=A0A231MZT4_9GAMM|nr:AzlC family ABC transporter permease [Zobellella denitrificans]ATG72972.1 AzlC family protein [Zobellella denitrificans]OXS15751.1 branched-chain amino acid transporter AzlC [Zobellella denitrificans]